MSKFSLILTIFLLFLSTNTLSMAQEGWFSVSAGYEYTHVACSFIDADTGWVIKEANGVIKTINGGNEWEDQYINYQDKPGDIQFIDGNTGWMCGWNKSMFKTIDGGEHWQLILENNSPDYSFSYITSICFLDKNLGYCAGYQYKTTSSSYESILMKSVDGGEGWTPQTAGSHDYIFASIFFINENIGWVCGYSGKIFKTVNGGTNWIEQDSHTDLDLHSIFFINMQKGWAVGQEGIILVTSDGGDTWITQTSPTSSKLSEVQFLNENIGYACGSDNTILKTLEGGTDWHQQNSGSDAMFSDIVFLSPDTGYCVGWEGTILKTVNGGVGTNSIEISDMKLPKKVRLYQNHPNPFNPSTKIKFTLHKSEFVELKVFNILGKEVTTLVSNKLNQGNHTYTFDSKNLASGIYYYQLVAGEFQDVKKMILLR
jgi:photosystem II stability/assembly factor-like uncharacterized protein